VKPTPKPRRIASPPLPILTTRSEIARQSSAQASSTAPEAPAEIVAPKTNMIYIEKVGTNAVISWLNTDSSRSFYLYTTNVLTPMAMWQLPNHWFGLRSVNSNMTSVTFTNQLPVAFFRLVTVSTNTLGVGWSYDYEASPEVDSYVLRYGNTPVMPFAYTNVIDGKRLWSTVTLPTIETNWFFTLTTRISTNGIESGVSSLAVWPPTP
jgi:hypothetical protein